MMRGMRWSIRSCLAILPIVCAACAEESSSSEERRSVPTGDAGASGDASVSGDAGVDPAGGRSDTPSACYAACSNASYTCESGTATTKVALAPSPTGCEGTVDAEGKGATVKIDCVERKICIGTECGPGTFSATTYAYGETICTRE